MNDTLFQPREGALYKRVTLFGETFDLCYGYYEDKDRGGAPDVIYPDFIQDPVYTDDGTPFVTMMQDACEKYIGKNEKTPDTSCADCQYFRRGEEWFGVCACPKNKKPNDL